MSKRLRKRIRELCGLEGLERTERRKLAQTVLDSPEHKQRLCNQVPGLSYRDIDRTMKNVLAENQPTESELEEAELRAVAPQKFELDAILAPLRKKNKTEYRALTREETRKLIELSNAPVKNEAKPQPKEYDTWLPEEVQALMDGTYDPANFRHLRNKKR